ncbi:MAG: nucleotidyltransferase domain-containing protein [archaeon]
MYKKLNITENALQVLSLFTNDFGREYYVREVGKLLKISPRTAQLILEELEDKGVVESKAKGKIKAYKIRLSEFTKRYLVFVEQYKAISFLEDNLMPKEVIEKIAPHIKGIGIIFGSYAKGTQNKESDLDIFVAGDYAKEEIEKVSRNLGMDISMKCYPIKIFKRNIKTDVLVREILKNHIVFANAEQFIQVVLRNG